MPALLLALANFAPLLAKYLGAGTTTEKVAAVAVQVAQTVTGAISPEEAVAKLAASSELQQKFQLAVLEKSVELDKLYLADIEDARKRDVELAKAGQKNFRADFLVAVAIVVVIALTVLVVWHSDLYEYVKGIITLVLGRFLGYIDQIYNFDFGTTRSSRGKDDTINKLAGGS
jgi:hypothetical protein